MATEILPIAALGGPVGWTWRGPQEPLIRRILDSKKKYILLQAEPGIGKTSIAWGVAQHLAGNTCILVLTKQLQRQYLRDFKLPMIQGRVNYQCLVSPGTTTDKGPCTAGIPCMLMGGQDGPPRCPYFAAKLDAVLAKVSIHNYHYWLNETRPVAGRKPSAFYDVNCLVLDEAHELDDLLREFDTLIFEQSELHKLGLVQLGLPVIEDVVTDHVEDIKWWSDKNIEILGSLIAGLISELEGAGIRFDEGGLDEGSDIDQSTMSIIGKLRRHQELHRKFHEVRTGPLYEGQAANWVLDTSDQNEVKLRPLSGRRSMVRIGNGAQKILLMSAFLAPKLLMRRLGLRADECEIIEAPEAYDRTKSPFILLPVTRMSFKTPESDWIRTVKTIDEIIENNYPKSGLVIVNSVRLRDTVRRHSRHKDKLITYDAFDPNNRFKRSMSKDEALNLFTNFARQDKQRVLLGQSISTGIDLPYLIAFNIVVKMAYPPMTDPVLKLIMERDSLYQPYKILCQMMQAAGRSKRADDHDCVTYLLDGHFMRFFGMYKDHFPGWFRDNLIYGGPQYRQMVAHLLNKGVRLMQIPHRLS